MSVTSCLTSHVIFALSFLLSGCVYHDYPTPQIEGTLTNAGEPLAGVAVSLTEFDRPIATVQTDSNGHFSMVPQGNWHVFIPVGPQDRLSRWTLTIIDLQGQELSIYTRQRLGGVFSGYSRNDRVKLICELSSAGGKSRSQESKLFCEPAGGDNLLF
ncbi:carboxypeptidase regulatory-like domain-containing protein [Brenneria sp. 4F2]|nr:carboxypeptidase regulatory-like domain-containing protein [Brenneria bubanii]